VVDDHLQIVEERKRTYGDPDQCYDSVGLVWRGILQYHYGIELPEIPGNIVELMLSGMKLIRASSSSGSNHWDSYVDARNYVTLAETYVKNRNGKV
jgi:hypothetical protein